MTGLVALLTCLLSALGPTVMVVRPDTRAQRLGPHQNIARKIFQKPATSVLGCCICAGFWRALILSPMGWLWHPVPWVWFGCLMAPAIFWIILGNRTPAPPEDDHPQTP